MKRRKPPAFSALSRQTLVSPAVRLRGRSRGRGGSAAGARKRDIRASPFDSRDPMRYARGALRSFTASVSWSRQRSFGWTASTTPSRFSTEPDPSMAEASRTMDRWRPRRSSRMEQAGAVVPWTERYRRKLGDEPAPGKRVERAAIRDALGQMRRYPDWLALFLEEFREGPWEPSVDRWVYELAPGIRGRRHPRRHPGRARGASLARHDTPGRRKELARGFAYWASTHQTLPLKETWPAHLTPRSGARARAASARGRAATGRSRRV